MHLYPTFSFYPHFERRRSRWRHIHSILAVLAFTAVVVIVAAIPATVVVAAVAIVIVVAVSAVVAAASGDTAASRVAFVVVFVPVEHTAEEEAPKPFVPSSLPAVIH